MTCPACTDVHPPGTAFCGQCGARVHDRLLGTVLDDRYLIDTKLAAGGFGSVYRATFLATGQEVAIKVLHDTHSADPSTTARFRREALTLSSLCDPHTVTTHEVGIDRDGTRFIVMELLRGESLAERFDRVGAMPWRTVLSILRDVCSSLVEAHALGIVHRDLKPANIFLAATAGEPDFVKVLDFGIAKIIHGSNMHDGNELTRIGQAIGTLEYMAPEQLVGGDVDARTDIYTLGVVAYELLTGVRPFGEATNATALVTALMTRRPAPPSLLIEHGPLPRELDGVLLRCLEREATDRYADIRELAAVIERMLAQPVEAATTQHQWRASTVRAVFQDSGDHDEITWIDARPPVPTTTPMGAVAAHVAPASPVYVPVPVAPAPAPTPRSWRAVGTGVPWEPEAIPQPRMPVGSSPVIPGPAPEPDVEVAPRSRFARTLFVALVLAATGVGIGAAVAMLAT